MEIMEGAIVTAVRACKTREALDGLLERIEIGDTQKTIDLLNTCMYKPETFAPPKPISPEDELEFAKQILLTGTWRLNEYFEYLDEWELGQRAPTKRVCVQWGTQ